MKSQKTNKLTLSDHRRIAEHLELLKPKSKAGRVSYLKQIAEESKILAEEIEELLPSLDRLSSFLETPPPLAPVLPLKTLGEFEIIREVGQGGFATVYLAKHIPLQRLVALKVSTQAAEEGRTLARLEHNHIVRVFDEKTDPSTGLHWTSMQFIFGTSLHSIIANLSTNIKTGKDLLSVIEGLTPADTPNDPAGFPTREILGDLTASESLLWMGIRLADALAYAHSQGILHLDIKPGNILISSHGKPYLTDFNISTRNFGGTWDYMPPEQKAVFESAHGKSELIRNIDGRVDVFAFGLVLKEMFSQKPTAKIQATLTKASNPIREERFQSAKELKEALEACLEETQRKKDLRKKNLSIRQADKHPILAMTLVGTLPQLAASLIGTLYNKFNVIASLSSAQQNAFELLNRNVTPLFFVIGGAFWAFISIRISRKMRSVDRWDAAQVEQLRKKALFLPKWGGWINTVSWFGSYLLFIHTLHFKHGPLEERLLFHLSASFLVSWLISFSYTSLFQYYISLRNLCPRFLELMPVPWRLSEKEVKSYVFWIRVCLAMVILIPNLATILLVTNLTSTIPVDLIQSIRVLSIALVSTSILGLIVAVSLSEKLARTLTVFSNLK